VKPWLRPQGSTPRRGGISSYVRPWSIRLVRSFRTPPHFLKKNRARSAALSEIRPDHKMGLLAQGPNTGGPHPLRQPYSPVIRNEESAVPHRAPPIRTHDCRKEHFRRQNADASTRAERRRVACHLHRCGDSGRAVSGYGFYRGGRGFQRPAVRPTVARTNQSPAGARKRAARRHRDRAAFFNAVRRILCPRCA
jgi:hypothetical protein